MDFQLKQTKIKNPFFVCKYLNQNSTLKMWGDKNLHIFLGICIAMSVTKVRWEVHLKQHILGTQRSSHGLCFTTAQCHCLLLLGLEVGKASSSNCCVAAWDALPVILVWSPIWIKHWHDSQLCWCSQLQPLLVTIHWLNINHGNRSLK